MNSTQKFIFGCLALSAGCISEKYPTYTLPDTRKPISQEIDPDLTLIQKEMPNRYSGFFDTAELMFSTNHSQATHMRFKRFNCPEVIELSHKIPLGTTKKQSDWDKLFLKGKPCLGTGQPHDCFWQKFY